MTPFAAWLAMDVKTDQPKPFPSSNGPTFIVLEKPPVFRLSDHARVLIVPDTEENRRKLEMEE